MLQVLEVHLRHWEKMVNWSLGAMQHLAVPWRLKFFFVSSEFIKTKWWQRPKDDDDKTKPKKNSPSTQCHTTSSQLRQSARSETNFNVTSLRPAELNHQSVGEKKKGSQLLKRCQKMISLHLWMGLEFLTANLKIRTLWSRPSMVQVCQMLNVVKRALEVSIWMHEPTLQLFACRHLADGFSNVGHLKKKSLKELVLKSCWVFRYLTQYTSCSKTLGDSEKHVPKIIDPVFITQLDSWN